MLAVVVVAAAAMGAVFLDNRDAAAVLNGEPCGISGGVGLCLVTVRSSGGAEGRMRRMRRRMEAEAARRRDPSDVLQSDAERARTPPVAALGNELNN